MLRRLQDLQSWTVETHDDRVIGHVDDFYLDDQRWTVRYIAVSTGYSFPERPVLISTLGIEEIDWDGARIVIDLTREQVRTSPSGGARGVIHTPLLHRDSTTGIVASPGTEERSCLRSVRGVRGCLVHAPNGMIGHVEDVFADDEVWTIPYFAVNAGQWIEGTMLIPPTWIRHVDWEAGAVHVNVASEDIKTSRQGTLPMSPLVPSTTA